MALASTPIAASMPARFSLRWQALMVLLFNTLVGAVLAFSAGAPLAAAAFWHHTLYAQCVGFSIFGSIYLVAWSRGTGACPQPRDLAVGVALGAVAGNLLGAFATGTAERDLAEWGGKLFIALAFGAFASYYFFATVRIAHRETELREQETRRLTAEAQLTATRLRLLQAQIEPHFLFNTLSTIHGLIESDPPRAARMLESLTRLLRASLKRTREGDTTLGDELALVRAYLEIQQQRLGERLRYAVDAPEPLLPMALPPLLIQPLVENAVGHGIEPALEGGAVTVRVHSAAGMLHIDVTDTGRGLGTGGAGQGVGLANVAERLRALYGDGAALQVQGALPYGVHASLSLPMPGTEVNA